MRPRAARLRATKLAVSATAKGGVHATSGAGHDVLRGVLPGDGGQIVDLVSDAVPWPAGARAQWDTRAAFARKPGDGRRVVPPPLGRRPCERGRGAAIRAPPAAPPWAAGFGLA